MKVLSKANPIPKHIIDGCIANEKAVQKKLYDLLLPLLSSVCCRYLKNRSDLNDALQESFINIFNKIDQFDADRGSLKSWAVKIAVNCSIKLNARMYKLETVDYANTEGHQVAEAKVFEQLDDEDLLQLIQKMPAQYLNVFNMYVIDDFSHKEIASALSITESLSRKRLSRARNWINENLENIRSEHLQIRNSG